MPRSPNNCAASAGRAVVFEGEPVEFGERIVDLVAVEEDRVRVLARLVRTEHREHFTVGAPRRHVQAHTDDRE